MVLLLVLLLSPKVSAQSLFDGVPEPSMENYAQIWEQITGLPYRPDSSTLLLGQELSQGVFELVAVQPSDIPSEAVVAVVGSVQPLTIYPHSWILPWEYRFTVTGDNYTFDATVTFSSRSTAALIETNTGLLSPIVADLGDIRIEITDGMGDEVVIGDTTDLTALLPFGTVTDISTADMIAERIAALAAYEGDPIDLNAPPLFDPDDDTYTITHDELLCQAGCQSTYDSNIQLCRNAFFTNLRNCKIRALVAVGGGCVSAIGGRLCSLIPGLQHVTLPVCCAAGGVIGGTATYLACRAIARNNFSRCMDDAFERFRLCMLLNCGIEIYEE